MTRKVDKDAPAEAKFGLVAHLVSTDILTMTLHIRCDVELVNCGCV